MTKPVLEKLAREYQDKVDFWPINSDEHQGLLQELKIYGIPTVLLIQNGEVAGRHTGAQREDTYRQMFEALANGQSTVQISLRPMDRIFRLGAGTIIALVGINGGNWLLIGLGALLAFLGVYDRCPVWRAITGWWRERTSRS